VQDYGVTNFMTKGNMKKAIEKRLSELQ